MREVAVIGEDLNGLGWTLKSLMDDNLANDKVWKAVRKISGTMVVTETAADVSVTIFFEKGGIKIQDGAIANPTARLAAGFEELSEVAGGQTGPVKALLTGKIKAGGNLIQLLRMARVIITRD